MAKETGYLKELNELIKEFDYEQIAKAIGVSERSLYNYRSEENPSIPHAKTAKKIHEVYMKYKNGEQIIEKEEEKNAGTEDITLLYRQTLNNQIELSKGIQQLQVSLNKLTLIASGKLVLPEEEIHSLEASLGRIPFENSVQILGEKSKKGISTDQHK